MDKIIAIMVVIMIWAFIVFTATCFITETVKTKSSFWDTLMTISYEIGLALAIILLVIVSFTVVDEYIL